MKNFYLLVIALLTAVIGGCAVAPVALIIDPTNYYISTSAILEESETPESGYGAYGYLVFTKRPGKKDRHRYLAVCKAFVRNLEPSQIYQHSYNIKKKSL